MQRVVDNQLECRPAEDHRHRPHSWLKEKGTRRCPDSGEVCDPLAAMDASRARSSGYAARRCGRRPRNTTSPPTSSARPLMAEAGSISGAWLATAQDPGVSLVPKSHAP